MSLPLLCRFGSLLTTSDTSGLIGSILLFHPFFLKANYLEYDLEFKDMCCYQSDQCNLYSERRPADNCASYLAPRFSTYFMYSSLNTCM